MSGRWRSRSACPGSTRPWACIPHEAAQVDEAAWAWFVDGGPGPAGRGGRRDGPRLRPRVQPDPGPAGQPPAQPRARDRDRQAGDPPLPVGGRAARRAGRPRRGAARRRFRRAVGRGRVRRPAAGDRPQLLGAGRLRRDDARAGLRDQLRWPRVPARGRSRARRSRRSSRRDRLLVETDSPFLSPPGAPRGATSPSTWRSRPPGSPSAAGSPPTCSGRSSWRPTTPPCNGIGDRPRP